MTSPRDHHPV